MPAHQHASACTCPSAPTLAPFPNHHAHAHRPTASSLSYRVPCPKQVSRATLHRRPPRAQQFITDSRRPKLGLAVSHLPPAEGVVDAPGQFGVGILGGGDQLPVGLIPLGEKVAADEEGDQHGRRAADEAHVARVVPSHLGEVIPVICASRSDLLLAAGKEIGRVRFDRVGLPARCLRLFAHRRGRLTGSNLRRLVTARDGTKAGCKGRVEIVGCVPIVLCHPQAPHPRP
mmetsp:Transcript_10989/g.36453  ORF Transcript_10989/g.36453 Transcript_10989/m.36453 type:complete len:230 (-) Transcript_10989:68-757(-)